MLDVYNNIGKSYKKCTWFLYGLYKEGIEKQKKKIRKVKKCKCFKTGRIKKIHLLWNIFGTPCFYKHFLFFRFVWMPVRGSLTTVLGQLIFDLVH